MKKTLKNQQFPVKILQLCKLTNNLPDVFDQFFKSFKGFHNHNTRGSQQYFTYVMLLKLPNTQVFGSNLK